MIRYASVVSSSVVDGLGIRVVAFLQGCPFHCEGCHNPELQPVLGGTEVTEKQFTQMLLDKLTPVHKGITFSGGDPLMQADELYIVLKTIKEQKPDLDIWVYTGFSFEEVRHLPVMKLIDVLVDGPFVLELKDFSLPFRGSANQRIINVTRSLAEDLLIMMNIA